MICSSPIGVIHSSPGFSFENPTRHGHDALSRLIFATMLVAGVRLAAFGQQVADPDFNTRVDRPAYTDRHPAVPFDKAHKNYHTADGRCKPFTALITNDGYAITPGRKKFSKETLKGSKS